MSERRFFSLSDITGRIQAILQPHIGKRFWVKAEISSGRERGGSFYCDLVETDDKGQIIAQMRCAIWSRDLARIRKRFKDHDLELTLDDGTAVGFECSLQYSPQYSLSLKVIDADPAFALGELELKKKELLDRLKKEGLLKPNKALFVPTLPLKIGLVSSKNSAACNDFIKTLKTSMFGFRVYLADAIVQGRQAEASVLYALGTLEHFDLELVVIVRGGGSTEITLFSQRKTMSLSFDIGTVRILDGLVKEKQWRQMRAWVKEQSSPYRSVTATGSGGNINKIVKFAKGKNGKSVTLKKIRKIQTLLNTYTEKVRVTELGLKPDRADVIIPAMQIYLSVMKWSGTKKIRVPQIGLADGLVRMMYARYQNRNSDISYI